VAIQVYFLHLHLHIHSTGEPNSLYYNADYRNNGLSDIFIFLLWQLVAII